MGTHKRSVEEDQFDKQESAHRLDAILRGAFSGSPTPLKDVPKKNGESRVSKVRGVSDATARTAKRPGGNLV
jgi:hypothetical protein